MALGQRGLLHLARRKNTHDYIQIYACASTLVCSRSTCTLPTRHRSYSALPFLPHLCSHTLSRPRSCASAPPRFHTPAPPRSRDFTLPRLRAPTLPHSRAPTPPRFRTPTPLTPPRSCAPAEMYATPGQVPLGLIISQSEQSRFSQKVGTHKFSTVSDAR
jgi:hypothetical protein